jgi:hypothetical protein
MRGAGPQVLRVSLVGACLAALVAAPFLAASQAGLTSDELLREGLEGLAAAIAAVGWVLVPQILLAVAILSLALQQLSGRLAGVPVAPTPRWLDPAVESALLLGLLGTISGMVSGFVGLSPDELQPGPLVHSLGTALRSSFVGFLIALVGVWVKAQPGLPSTEAAAARTQPARTLPREAEPA